MPNKDEQKRKEVQKRADAKRAGKRARAWTAMVYPESAPADWQDRLAEQLTEALVSPLHDKDVWTEADEAENGEHKAGTPKKAHWHVVISFKNPTSYEKAKGIFEAIGAVVPPESKSQVKDFQQMARYLCHLDQPNKHRYDTKDVRTYGAIDYASLVMSGADEDEILDEMEQFIDDNMIVSWRQFCTYVRTERPEWKALTRRKYAAYLCRYIKSLEWELEQAQKNAR